METDADARVDQLKSWVKDFCDARDWERYHTPKDLAIGLVTEASELLEIFRFISEQKVNDLIQQPEQRAAIADELADSLFFILRFSELYKFDLSQVLQQKLIKNAKKYPPTNS